MDHASCYDVDVRGTNNADGTGDAMLESLACYYFETCSNFRAALYLAMHIVT